MEEIFRKTQKALDELINILKEDLKTLHAGRATAGLVENIAVSYYGQNVPLKQIASIIIPASNTIQIMPYDQNSIGDIELALRNCPMAYNPQNEGRIIRLFLPPLSAERRQQLVKLLHQKAEEVKVEGRIIRQKGWEEVQKMEKAGQATEDDRYRCEERLNKIISGFNSQVQDIILSKEKEITTL